MFTLRETLTAPSAKQANSQLYNRCYATFKTETPLPHRRAGSSTPPYLTLIEERLQDIALLMRVCFGDDSQATIRADEAGAALQRLKWELERTKLRAMTAGQI